MQHTVERELLPSLSFCRAEVEALRVYLILPELIRVLQEGNQKTQLAVYLADAIEKLAPCDALGKTYILNVHLSYMLDSILRCLLLQCLIHVVLIKSQQKTSGLECHFHTSER